MFCGVGKKQEEEGRSNVKKVNAKVLKSVEEVLGHFTAVKHAPYFDGKVFFTWLRFALPGGVGGWSVVCGVRDGTVKRRLPFL